MCACDSVAKKIDDLQEILKKKDEDMRRLEDKYKKYVEKARTVRSHTHNLITHILSDHTFTFDLCVSGD